MNLKDKIIIEEYRKNRNTFFEMGEIVHKKLKEITREVGAPCAGIEHRVKAEQSLAGKLERRGDKINVFEDLTDILGARVICFFSDDVYKIGKLVEKHFIIDWDNSEDKRRLLKPTEFGYMSLHYIASLPDDGTLPEEFRGKKFEIQIRTLLQHAWADIEHDMGYKSEFGVPDEAARSFSKLSCLLEVADDEFVRVRDDMKRYSDRVRDKIINDDADDVPIDSVSLKEYVLRNTKMQAFLKSLADICGSEISVIEPESYIEQLKWLGKTTIGDVQRMLEEDSALAFRLAERSLAGTELDIISSNVGLRFLTRAELLLKGYTREKAEAFLTIQTGKADRAKRQAKYLYDSYEKMTKE